VEDARQILRVELWEKQAEIAAAALSPPYKVLVKSGHSCGKSFLAAVLVSWFADAAGGEAGGDNPRGRNPDYAYPRPAGAQRRT
jgi:hypothetical protein